MHRKPRLQAGYTLLEAILVLAVLGSMVSVVVNLIASSSESLKYSERLSRATEVNQELLSDLRNELMSSVGFFERGALANSINAALEPTSEAIPIGTSTLPTVDATGVFVQESASGVKTGNEILFAKQAFTTRFTCTSGVTYSFDVYRVVRYYQSVAGDGPQPDSPIGVNLCKFVSEPLIDGAQIDKVLDPMDHAEVLTHLVSGSPDKNGVSHAPASLVWLRGTDPAALGNIRQIHVNTWVLSDTPIAPRPNPWVIKRDRKRSSNGLLYYRHFSICSNYARGTRGVGKFAVIDNTGDGFPHGLEVQVIGPPGGHQMLINLSIATANTRGQTAFSNMKSTQFVEDI